MKNDKKLTQSLEKYLLAIYEIVEKNTAARVKDVSNYLNIGGPATSDAVKTLAKKGYINYVPYGIITLTVKGRKKAEEKIERHKIISNFLEHVLMVEADKVDKNAQAIEFSVCEDVLEKFTRFLAFMDKCSCKEPKWMKSYSYYSLNNEMQFKCQECMQSVEKCCSCQGCCN